MRTGRKYPILLALTLFLAAYALRPASAQAQSRRAPPGAQTPKDYQALMAPVPEDELERFETDFTTLVRALHDLNALHPDVQSSMIETEHQLAALTPEQWTVLANAYDRPTVSQSVERLSSLLSRLNATPGLAVGPSEAGSGTPGRAALTKEDDSTTTTLTVANYGICAPSPAPSFLGADSIPSTTVTDYNLFTLLNAGAGAAIPLYVACETIVVIAGEGTNLPFCVIYGIALAVNFAFQAALQADEFCDSNVLAAENDAAYFNTIAIFNNLATDTSLITNQTTSTQNDLDTHITNVDSDVNAHITAIDADIDSHVTGINTNVNTSIANANSNLNAQITAIDTDIDGRVTAVGTSVANAASSLSTQITSTNTDIDTRLAAVNTNTSSSVSAVDTDIVNHVAAATVNIATAVTNADTDLNNHLTAVDTDLNTHLAAVDADVQAQGSQVGSQITTLQALNLRLEIEQSLAAGASIGVFETPKAHGGYLEVVGTTVQTVINGLVAAGKSVGKAQTYENQGNTDFAAGNFKTAYYDYMSAYQTAVR